MAIYIENDAKTVFSIHYRELIGKVVRRVMQDKAIPAELDVNVLIVTKDEIRQINRRTRDLDQVTDVLSFPYFEFDVPGVFDPDAVRPEEEEILGDIVICGDRVLEQAAEYGHSVRRELAFLTVHSMLHLIGYDHMEPADAAVMEAEQKRIMEELGIGR